MLHVIVCVIASVFFVSVIALITTKCTKWERYGITAIYITGTLCCWSLAIFPEEMQLDPEKIVSAVYFFSLMALMTAFMAGLAVCGKLDGCYARELSAKSANR